MKTLLFVIVANLSLALTTSASGITPDEPEKPLFQIFEPIFIETDNPDKPMATWDDKKPLLTVHSVRDLILAHDNKGVMLGLNAEDTKTLAELTRKFELIWLLLKVDDDAMEVWHITAPIEDGYIAFEHPEKARMAEYLRRRFRIAEFK